jgi:hypothetical protein
MNYYLDIDDLPLINWKKCQNGHLIYTRKNSDVGTEEQDIEAWEQIYNSYLKAFGLSKKFKVYLVKQAKFIRLLKEYAINGDDFLWNEIEIVKSEIDEVTKVFDVKGNSSIDEAVVYVSKWIGSFIDESKVTTKQFYTAYHKMIEENGKEN